MIAPTESVAQILVGLLPNNRVMLQVAIDGKVMSYVELDKMGAMQVSGQLAEMASKLDDVQ